MLLQLYPRDHRRYLSLPVFGPIVENFGTWLLDQGYSTDCIREHFCCMRRIARLLLKRGVGSVAELTRAKLVLRLLAAISALPAAPTSPFRWENLRVAIVLRREGSPI
jgi:hypothetical protein